MVKLEARVTQLETVLALVDEAMGVLRPQCTEGADVADILDSFIPEVRAALGSPRAPATLHLQSVVEYLQVTGLSYKKENERLEALVTALETEVSRWKRSFEGHVYVPNDKYATLVAYAKRAGWVGVSQREINEKKNGVDYDLGGF